MSLTALLQRTGIVSAEPDDDTGLNVPESPATLAAQARAVAEKRQRAFMIPRGTPEPALPQGFARVETPRGVFHFDPEQISADEIETASAAHRENEVLGLGPASKADVLAHAAQGEPVAAVTERRPNGTEVKAAIATPATAPAALREISARAAPDSRVQVEPLPDVLAGRVKPAARGVAALLAATGGNDPAQSIFANARNQATRGALDHGFYRGLEGLARLTSYATEEAMATVPGSDTLRLQREREDLLAQNRRIEGVIEGQGSEPSFGNLLSPEEETTIQRNAARVRGIDQQLTGLRSGSLPARYAGAVADTRQRIRSALPVDERFQRSLGGQIIAGIGQAAGMLPAYLVPGAGPSLSIGLLYSQGREDALAHGADERDAHKAGMANVPAAALDVASDKLLIARMLRPLRGSFTVQGLRNAVALTSAVGGGSNATQQVWANHVARTLAAYDPDRPLDDEVINSLVVGAAVAGMTTAVGQTATAPLRPREPATAGRQSNGLKRLLAQTDPAVTARDDAPASLPALESNLKRLLTGRMVWEGSADVLRRSGLGDLAAAVDKHVDATERNLATAWAPIKEVLAPYQGMRGLLKYGEAQHVFDEFATYFSARESGDSAHAAGLLDQARPETRRLIAAVGRMAEVTGDINQRIGVKVRDRDGRPRPIDRLGAKFFPRVIREDVAAVLRDPSSDPARWRELTDELIAGGYIKSPEEALAYTKRFLPDTAPETSRADYLPGLERGRGERLPASFYEYRFEKVIPAYVAAWADRTAQIEAFGQKLGAFGTDAFDEALATVQDESLRNYIRETRAAAYRMSALPHGARRALGNVTAATTGLLLGNPYSTFRNLIGGTAQTTTQFGPVRAAQALRDAWRTAAAERAESAGALKADVADLLFHGEGSPAAHKAAGQALKLSGFNAAENFVRTHNLLTAQGFLRDSLPRLRDEPQSRAALQATAFFRRLNLDPDKLQQENGRGPETDRYLRGAVREAQGGYRYNQTPLFTQSPLGRFLFQFHRWGTQATRFQVKHVLMPALRGELVPVQQPGGGTKQQRVRTLAPLLRSPLVALAAGAVTYAGREALFGLTRTDATWHEVFESLDEDEQRGFALALDRLVNNVVMAGTFGAVADYSNTLRWAIRRGEPRSPVDPPAVSLAREVVALGQKAQQQGGTLSAQDYREFVGRMITAAKYVPALVFRFADAFGLEWSEARRHRAEQDRRFARAVGRRFAEAKGYPDPAPLPEGVPLVNVRSPVYDRLEDALHRGDVGGVQSLLTSYLADSLHPRLRAWRRNALRNAVLNRMPMRPGGRPSQDDRDAFRVWMRSNLSAPDRKRIEDAQDRFILTAVRGGLLTEQDADRYADP